MIFALGRDAAGFSLFVWQGKARFHYNFFGMQCTDLVSPERLSPGKHEIVVTILPEAPAPGVPAKLVLSTATD